MEDEKDIQPSVHPQKNKAGSPKAVMKNQVMEPREQNTASPEQDGPIPHYEDLHAAPAAGATSEEVPASYSQCLKSLPEFPWHLDEESRLATPTLDAPYITGHATGVMTEEELVAGIFINVPRSPKLWTGDQLKMRWGCNTFYTTIPAPNGRTGPRLSQYLNCERLATYKNGEIEVRYEVVRRSRLVGVSETLTIMLRGGKTRPKPASRARSIRRRKLHE